MMNAIVFISKEAKRLQKAHPRQYVNWKDAQAKATQTYNRHYKGKNGIKKSTHKKKSMPAKKKHLRTVKRIASPRPAPRTKSSLKGVKPRHVVGSVSYYTTKARKLVEEQMAWLLLQISQTKKKSIRNKLLKKKTALSAKLRGLSR